MNEPEIKEAVRAALSEVAPEADLDALDPEESIQDQLDIDSLDFLSVMIGIHERTGVDVPERDYPKLGTFAGCVAYLLEAGAPAPA